MNLADPKILNHLTATPDPDFETVYDRITNAGKTGLRSLLIYLDKVLMFMLRREADGLHCTQLHFPDMDTAAKDVLLEYLIIRGFYHSLAADTTPDSYAQERLVSLQNRLTRSQAPAEASGKNGGNPAYRRWMAPKKAWQDEIALLTSIAPSQPFSFRDTYIFSQEEVDQLTTDTLPASAITWIGDHSELFADYSDLVTSYGAGRFRSLAVLNIFTAAMSPDMAGLIVSGLFGDNTTPALFDAETRSCVNGLSPQEKDTLRAALQGIMELILVSWEEIGQNLRNAVLLSQMIDEGLFEPNFDWAGRPLEHFLELHELEEKGMTRENLTKELQALVLLMTDKLQLQKVQKIERS